ncbi:hypothetical protein ACFPPA_05795 [Rhodanobacter ginsengisoli]|uniref:Uncharacterized protein n=1 Tax=Rhodanobacter ginsengisoli TaxID=418646 RepID=A0ABW0QNV5_9GAMM
MNVLKSVQKAIALRLSKQSNETLDSLRRAEKCILFLHMHGCTVQNVSVRRDHIVIDIDQPGTWLTGSIFIRRVHGSMRELHRVARVMGCQVQWVEREAHVLLQREG